jgi:hypothetical protein
MTISFHRWDEDEDTDEAFTFLRKSVDEPKEMEEKEFGGRKEVIEEKDVTAFVEAPSHDEERLSSVSEKRERRSTLRLCVRQLR